MKKRKVGSGGHNIKPIIYDGQIFNSRTELAKRMNVSISLIRHYLRTGRAFKGNCIDEPF